ncbi:MAG: methyltransferase family protein [Nitrospinota bacterium]
MIKKSTAIEILPRALGVINLAALFLGQYLTKRPPILNDNIFIIVIGIVLALAAFSFWMSSTYYMRHAFHTKELITDGPFKYSRHPMYLGAYFTMIGIGVLFFSWLWFAILLVFIPIWCLNCRLEEKQMTEIWGDKYLDYKKKTGMFLPRLG